MSKGNNLVIVNNNNSNAAVDDEEWPHVANSSEQSQRKGAEKAPQSNQQCIACNNKECYVTVGSGRNQKKQKTDFKWIECDMCIRWFHSTCQDLKVAEANSIFKLAKKGVKWYCTECNQSIKDNSAEAVVPQMLKLGSLQQMVEQLSTRVDEYQNQTKEQVECLKKSWAEVANNGQMAKDMKVAMQASTSTNILLTAELQKKDNEERKNNAIIYGLEENKTAMEDINELMQKTLFKNYDKPLKAFRLNQKEEGKIRPIKLFFKDEQAKWGFLKRVNASLRSDNLFCKLDVNKETRNKEYQLREQIRKMRNECSGQGEYRIRDLTIEKKGESGNWVKMNPATNSDR